MISTKRPALALVMLALPALLGACQSAPRSRATQAAVANCRSEVDRVYAAQNRSDLSRRDNIDTPYAGSHNIGSISDGLSAQFGRDKMETSCLANATTGPATPQ